MLYSFIPKKYSYDFSYEEWKDANLLKYRMCFNAYAKEINIDLTYSFINSFLYFKSSEDIENAIKEVGEDNIIKYYFKIRDYQ